MHLLILFLKSSAERSNPASALQQISRKTRKTDIMHFLFLRTPSAIPVDTVR